MAGEHLVESSAKLVLVDRLLSSLHSAGHKVLLFSQMKRMLDILQDYLTLRGEHIFVLISNQYIHEHKSSLLTREYKFHVAF